MAVDSDDIDDAIGSILSVGQEHQIGDIRKKLPDLGQLMDYQGQQAIATAGISGIFSVGCVQSPTGESE